MSKTYIVKTDDETQLLVEIGVNSTGAALIATNPVSFLTPYEEPDLEAIKQEAYGRGKNDAYSTPVLKEEVEEAYQKGLNDAWDAARKIVLSKEDGGLFGYEARKAVFGCGNYMALKKYTVSEVIEKIRQYEQEKEEGKKADFGKVRDVLRTTAKECHVTFDEIAEVLSGIMGEKTDGQE